MIVGITEIQTRAAAGPGDFALNVDFLASKMIFPFRESIGWNGEGQVLAPRGIMAGDRAHWRSAALCRPASREQQQHAAARYTEGDHAVILQINREPEQARVVIPAGVQRGDVQRCLKDGVGRRECVRHGVLSTIRSETQSALLQRLTGIPTARRMATVAPQANTRRGKAGRLSSALLPVCEPGGGLVRMRGTSWRAVMTMQTRNVQKLILAGFGMLFIVHRGLASPSAVADITSPQAQAQARMLAQQPPVAPPPGKRIVEDASGRNQVGKASVYAGHFQGRRMADGARFRHTGTAAASRSLPLGTVAKVKNLETGKTATVTVEDHGPFAQGRALDVSKATANQLGITRRQGVSTVEISPVIIPQRDGTLKPGAGAATP